MPDQPREPSGFDPDPDARKLESELLRLNSPHEELVSADDIETWLRLANLRWFLVNGPQRVKR
jgi:hypothetical protein